MTTTRNSKKGDEEEDDKKLLSKPSPKTNAKVRIPKKEDKTNTDAQAEGPPTADSRNVPANAGLIGRDGVGGKQAYVLPTAYARAHGTDGTHDHIGLLCPRMSSSPTAMGKSGASNITPTRGITVQTHGMGINGATAQAVASGPAFRARKFSSYSAFCSNCL